jgi:hypothetical protein
MFQITYLKTKQRVSLWLVHHRLFNLDASVGKLMILTHSDINSIFSYHLWFDQRQECKYHWLLLCMADISCICYYARIQISHDSSYEELDHLRLPLHMNSITYICSYAVVHIPLLNSSKQESKHLLSLLPKISDTTSVFSYAVIKMSLLTAPV